MAAVAGGIEQHVVGPPFEAAIKGRLQRLVGGVLCIERQVVAEDDEAELRFLAQQGHQGREASDVFAVDLDDLEDAIHLGVDSLVGRLDEGGLAHAARAPKQRIVGGKALGEAPGIFQNWSRVRSIPRRSESSTRLTLLTASSPGGLHATQRLRALTNPADRRRSRASRSSARDAGIQVCRSCCFCLGLLTLLVGP